MTETDPNAPATETASAPAATESTTVSNTAPSALADTVPNAAASSAPAATAQPTAEAPVTDPNGTISTPIPPHIKETFLQKIEIDAKEAWEWLEAEIKKI